MPSCLLPQSWFRSGFMIAVKRLRIENSEGRFVIQSVNVDLGTIDHSKPTVLTDESEKQIGATEDHRLGTRV